MRLSFSRNMLLLMIKTLTQLTHNVPGTSPEVPLKILTSGTYRGPSGNSQGTNIKTDDLMKNLCFRSSSPCIKDLFLHFTGRTNIQNF